MRAGDSPRIDMKQFLIQQRGERYHAFVLHGPPQCGKTTFAQMLAASVPGVTYLDVLKYIVERPALTQEIDLIDCTRLRKMALAFAAETQAQVLLLDEIDFLVRTWEDDLSAFQQMVRLLSVTQTSTIIGFILQTQHVLETWYLPNGAKQNRILHMEDVAAL